VAAGADLMLESDGFDCDSLTVEGSMTSANYLEVRNDLTVNGIVPLYQCLRQCPIPEDEDPLHSWQYYIYTLNINSIIV